MVTYEIGDVKEDALLGHFVTANNYKVGVVVSSEDVGWQTYKREGNVLVSFLILRLKELFVFSSNLFILSSRNRE